MDENKRTHTMVIDIELLLPKSGKWKNKQRQKFLKRVLRLGDDCGGDDFGPTRFFREVIYRDRQGEDIPPREPSLFSFPDEGLYKYWGESAPKGILSYCDSSIWAFDQNKWNGKAVEQWKIYQGQERYDLKVSHEYAEFAERKLVNSFLDGEHAAAICPFVFHSEGDLRNNFSREGEELNQLIKYIKEYKWKVLLVDDNAERGLQTRSNDGNNINHGKKEYIEEDLVFLTKDHSQNINFVISETIEKTSDLLRNGNRYDIILLDFKFDVKNEEGNVIKHEYGTDIIRGIKDNPNGFKPCPAGKYHFLFVSGYPDGVHDSMMADGIYSDTDKWFVRRGACPINTPYLFLYELLRLMEHRVKPLREHVDMVQNNNKTKEDAEKLTGPTAFEFISWLFSDGKVRDKCKNSFNAFLTLRATYDKIKYDVFDKKQKGKEGFVDEKGKESRLIRNMFPDVVCYSNTFWEHMQHLVYLAAYGTNRQWSEMWEELMSVSKTLETAEKEIGKPMGKEDGAVSLIRKYILGLKNGKY